MGHWRAVPFMRIIGAIAAIVLAIALVPAGASSAAVTGRAAHHHHRLRPLPLLPRKRLLEVSRPGVLLVRVVGKRMATGAASASPPATAAPSPPFNECPAVGADASCGILVQITDGGNTVLADPAQGPYDGADDTLVGILNSSSSTVTALQLSSGTLIFGFDGDGLCTFSPAPSGCPFGPTGYEGPGTSFSGITPDAAAGIVSFSPGVAPGGMAYFSLEEPLSSATVTAGGPSVAEQGGPPNSSENSTTCSTKAPVNCSTGIFWHEFTDLTIPGRGVPLNLTRTYASDQASVDGPFGFGWTDSYNMSLAIDPAGNATVTQADGSTVAFQPNGSGGFTAAPRVLATLTQNVDGSFTFIANRGQVQYNFSSAGQLTTQVDLNGYQTDLAYNASGHLATVTDPAGRTLTFTYSGSHVTAVTDSMGRAWSYAYDSNGNLVSATDPMGRAWSFSYDSNHLLLTMTDPRGGVTTSAYNGASQVNSQTDPAGRTTTWSYSGDPASSAGGVTTQTDPRGNVTTYAYSNLELTSVTHADGTPVAATTSYAYDPATLGVSSVTDPNGNVTTSIYDSSGNLVSTTDPLGNTTNYSYDSLSQVLSKTSPLGQTTSYSYDASGNLLSVTDPLSNTTMFSYGDAAHPGDITSVADPAGNAVSYSYDGYGNVASMTQSPSAGVFDVTTYAYDLDGERTCVASPNATRAHITCPAAGDPAVAGTTASSYNADGQVTSVTDPDGHVTTYSYDNDGNRVQVTDAAGHVTSYQFDADNELTKTTRPDGSVLRNTFDANGNLTTKINAAGDRTTYAYDARNQATSQTDPLGLTTTYGYDLAGNRTSLTDPAGLITTYSYDTADELTGISYSDGTTSSVGLTYDADGHRLTMTDGTGTTSYSYDGDGHLISVTNGAGSTVSYGYDPDGLLTSLGYPNGKTITRSYDGALRLTSVTDWLGHQTSFSYDADGNLTTISYPNGDKATSSFDSAGQVMGITDKFGSTTLASYTYSRSALGLLTSAVGTGALPGTQAYAYSQLSQLSSDSAGSYSYDQAADPTGLAGGIIQTFNAASELTGSTGPGVLAAPATDKVVSANETTKGSKVTSPSLRTKEAGELLLAFITANGPASKTQKISSVSGGGLTWSLVARADAKQGTAEIWQAHASTILSSAVITATLLRGGYDGSITVAAFTGAGAAGAHAAASGTRGAPSVSLTTIGNDSVAWATGEDPSHAVTVKARSGQTIVHRFADSAHPGTDWAQKSGAIAAKATMLKLGDSAPTADKWNLAAVEITAAPPVPVTISYGYDRNGDRTSVSASGTPAIRLTYDQAHRLTGYGASATYGYDGDGLRMSKTLSGATTRFAWDQSLSLPLVLTAGATSYVYGPDGQPIEQITGSMPTYLLADQLGSTRLLTSAAGTVAGTYSYNSYGQVTSHTGSAATALQFDGQYTDAESGYQYLRDRYYDPATGQFIGPDPAFSVTGAAYSYAYNDPLNLIDPSGDFAQILLGGLIGAGVGIFGGVLDYLTNPDANLWADVLGGAAGGFVGGACIAADPLFAAACGAAGALVTDLVKGAIDKPVSTCQLVTDLVSGAVGGAVGGKIIPFNKGWILPRNLSNIWNPGKVAKGYYEGALTGVSASLLGSDIANCPKC